MYRFEELPIITQKMIKEEIRQACLKFGYEPEEIDVDEVAKSHLYTKSGDRI